MLLSFLPICDKHGTQVMPSAMDYALNRKNIQGPITAKAWMATYIPLIFANAPNLAGKCANLCVDCKGILRMDVAELNLRLVFIELPDRFGYLALYNTRTGELLYLCYCGEITLMLAVKNIFSEGISGNSLKNICMVAPIDAVITAEEPYKSEWANFRTSLALSSFSYVYLDGSILKCKRIGKQGRDLQVVDKFYVTNKIPELNKALSHDPTCLINGKLIADGLNSDDDSARRLSDRLAGRTLPVARMGMATALTDTQNDADIIVALAKTKERDAICATLSNAWLKRAVKHKLNKFPPEFTSDNKYEVQRLTTEATIKYQGDSWKGAEKSDLIYVIVEKASRKPVSIISVGETELNYIKLRRKLVQDAVKQASPVIEHITLDFETAGVDKLYMLGFIDDMEEKPHTKALRKYVADYPKSKVSWIDLLNYEVEMAQGCADGLVTAGGTLAKFRSLNTSSRTETTSRKAYMFDMTHATPGRLTASIAPHMDHVFTAGRKYVAAQAREFNFPSITVTIPDGNGDRQTYNGKIKFGVALLKNVNDPTDTFMMFVEKTSHQGVGNSRYGCLSLCDYIFPTMPLHENTTYDGKVEKGYQIIVSNAIYGKKFKELGKVVFDNSNDATPALSAIAKLVSTGIEIPGNTFSSALSLGFLPDTYAEYCEMTAIDDTFDNMMTKHTTAMYTASSFDEDSLLDDMDDDGYEDLLEEEYGTGDDFDDGFDDGFDDSVGQTTDDDDELMDSIDYDGDDETDVWQTQRLLWLQRHPNSDYITDNGNQVYWFDIMHTMMSADQPDNANNIQLLETIWNSMLSKMQGYTAHDVMTMMYEQLKGTDESSADDDTTDDSMADLTDDDDDLFADL